MYVCGGSMWDLSVDILWRLEDNVRLCGFGILDGCELWDMDDGK